MSHNKFFINKKYIFITFAFLLMLIFFISLNLKNKLIQIIKKKQSIIIKDCNNKIISIQENNSNYYSKYSNSFPEKLKKLLFKKEDKYFYYHPDINPISTLRALSKITNKKNPSSSTITQQLTKILLKQEFERTFSNKLKELFYTFSLEIHLSKFAFYSKNYDYQYNENINLHYALSNSLNVPTVKVLEYIRLENFYNFLIDNLNFKPIQDIRNYQLGITLGVL